MLLLVWMLDDAPPHPGPRLLMLVIATLLVGRGECFQFHSHLGKTTAIRQPQRPATSTVVMMAEGGGGQKKGWPALRALKTFVFFNRPRIRETAKKITEDASTAFTPKNDMPLPKGVILVREQISTSSLPWHYLQSIKVLLLMSR